MPPLSPKQKKYLSAFAVVVAGSFLTMVNEYVVKFPPQVQGFVGSVLAAAMLLVKAWGSAEEEAVKVEVKAQARAADIVTQVLDKEAS